MLNSKEMAQILKMSRFGFQKLAKHLKVPYAKKRNKFLFDTQSSKFSDFFTSIQLAQINPNLKPLYSLRDLAKLRGQHKDTIKSFLVEHDIKMYHNGRKIVVLLVDLQRFQQLMTKNP
jgi:hypothetical protein